MITGDFCISDRDGENDGDNGGDDDNDDDDYVVDNLLFRTLDGNARHSNESWCPLQSQVSQDFCSSKRRHLAMFPA